MNDFSSLITAGEICPSIAFSLKPLDPTVLVHHPTPPKCVIRVVGRAIYSVTLVVVLVNHDDVAYSARSLEPASSAVPKAADKQHCDDNNEQGCGVHIVLLSGDKCGPRAVYS